MTSITTSIGCAQLERNDEARAHRKRLASWYVSWLSQIPGLVLPVQKDYAEHAYWMYTVLLPECSAETRDVICEMLESRGVETRPVFYPMHLLPPYEEDPTEYPKATQISSRGLNLPTHELVTEADVAYISEQLDSAIRSVRLSVCG